LSSRDRPGGSAALGGEGGDESAGGSVDRAGSAASSAGEAANGGSSDEGGSSAAGAPSAPGGAAGESGEGGSAGEPEPDGPVTIAENQIAPAGIAVDTKYVYWSNRDGGSIARCPRRGCGETPPTLLATSVGAPLGVAVDATSVYWVNAAVMEDMMNIGRIFKCPLSGCPDGGPKLVTEWVSGNQTNGLHVAGDQLYIAAWPLLGTCAIGGCEMPTSIGGGPFVSVATNGQYVFAGAIGWSELLRCPIAGCSNVTPLKVATKVGALGITLDQSSVYFCNRVDIEKCPLDGCGEAAPEVVVPGGGISPYGLTSSSTRLYFTNIDQGTVTSVPK
jgi:hypothetical protein